VHVQIPLQIQNGRRVSKVFDRSNFVKPTGPSGWEVDMGPNIASGWITSHARTKNMPLQP